ncbi:5659_t:CDS:2 [Dentiscutata erythropus]|uniref:5659_t:CDS:1 n=1 Tax=Dentiscutata erythropus TaxID=1348616 RepID=A0A9N9CYE7_9GLOM|nr:5659_t:CDS:2 [Dentiscutata erythropus]
MTRKYRNPKEHSLMLLNEHIKFLNRFKRKLPNQYHSLINKEKEKTEGQIVFVNREFTADYAKTIKELENELEVFKKQIRSLEATIRKLEKKTERKDERIDQLKNENEYLHDKINDRDNIIRIKDATIMEKDDQINVLQVDYDKSIDNSLDLSFKLEEERAHRDKTIEENNKYYFEEVRKNNEYEKKIRDLVLRNRNCAQFQIKQANEFTIKELRLSSEIEQLRRENETYKSQR